MILITIILIHKNGTQRPRNKDYNLFIEFRRPLTRANYKKFVLLLSLTIFDNNQNNKTLDQIPENLSLIFTKRK